MGGLTFSAVVPLVEAVERQYGGNAMRSGGRLLLCVLSAVMALRGNGTTNLWWQVSRVLSVNRCLGGHRRGGISYLYGGKCVVGRRFHVLLR